MTCRAVPCRAVPCCAVAQHNTTQDNIRSHDIRYFHRNLQELTENFLTLRDAVFPSGLDGASDLRVEEEVVIGAQNLPPPPRSADQIIREIRISGKPHIGSSETLDAGCWLAMPKAPDCGCFPRPANPRISAYLAPEVANNAPPVRDTRLERETAFV